MSIIFFNNWYRLGVDSIVRNDESTFERNFFGTNISIQAIVGKNGSGKSSILDLLYRLINNLSYVIVENKYRPLLNDYTLFVEYKQSSTMN